MKLTLRHRQRGAALLLPIALSFALVACGTLPSEGTTQAAANVSEPFSDGEILQVMHTLNSGEIQQAELALQRARSAEARRAAQRILEDHRSSNQRIESMAGSLGANLQHTALSRGLQAQAAGIREHLEGLSGTEFDCSYLEKQVELHGIALRTVRSDLMPHASAPQVRELLAQAAPTLDHHRQLAQNAPANQSVCTNAQLSAADDEIEG